jgi:hypothetical protein
MFVAVLEVGGDTFAAGLFPTARDARAAGDALADAHVDVQLRGVHELIPIGLAGELAAVFDELHHLGKVV